MQTRRLHKPMARLAFAGQVSPDPMLVEDWQTTEALLARFVARAYAADHPELFRPLGIAGENRESSGPPAAAAAVAGAPPVNAGGPEKWSMEHAAPRKELAD